MQRILSGKDEPCVNFCLQYAADLQSARKQARIIAVKMETLTSTSQRHCVTKFPLWKATFKGQPSRVLGEFE